MANEKKKKKKKTIWILEYYLDSHTLAALRIEWLTDDTTLRTRIK